MKTIFADYNAMTEAEQIRLNCPGSEADIRDAGVGPGDRVWLSDGEVLVGARLEVDPSYGLVGTPVWETLVHLDDTDAADYRRHWAELQSLLQLPGKTTET